MARPAERRIEKTNGGGSLRATARRWIGQLTFRLAIAVRSNLPETTKEEPHQFEPKPPGLIEVKSPVNRAVLSLVKASGIAIGEQPHEEHEHIPQREAVERCRYPPRGGWTANA